LRSTLDLDFNDKELIHRIVMKLIRCPFGKPYTILWRFSPSMNGFHIGLFCQCKVDVCRMAFDDQKRLEADVTSRPERGWNVLWDKKTYSKARKKITLNASEFKLAYYDTNTIYIIHSRL